MWKRLLLVALLFASSAFAQQPGTHPGANERFLDPQLDAAKWVKRFEGEAREIYASRSGIAGALEVAPGMQVADVGAGTGLFLPILAQAVGEDGRVYAVDVSPRFLEHLRARVEAEGLDRVEVVTGLSRTANLSQGSVDRVLLVDTYHHFEFPRAMLASLRKALRPGGELLVVDFERIPGTSRDWVLDHMRADKQTFTREIEAASFELAAEVPVEGLKENYVLRFRRP